MKKITFWKSLFLLCALIVGSTSAWAVPVFEKITSTEGLVAGSKYIVVCENQTTAMGTNVENNSKPYHTYVSGITNTTATIANPSSSVAVLTLGGETNAWTFTSNLTNNYLSLTKADNYLGESETDTDNKTKWTITFDDDGNAIIRNVAYPVRGGNKTNKNNPRYIMYNKSSGSERFACYVGTQQDVQLYRLIKETITISTAEYATLNSTCALDFSTTAISVYTATDNGTYVKLNEITSGKVPANTPVVLYKANADGTAIDVPVIASAEPVGDNDLAVVTTEGGMEGVANMFVLSKPAGKEVGFYAWKVGATLNKGKVYLQGKATSARDFLGFNEGNTTAIDNVVVKTVDANAPMYNLAGQRVNKSYKGVVIVNGKKMLNK